MLTCLCNNIVSCYDIVSSYGNMIKIEVECSI